MLGNSYLAPGLSKMHSMDLSNLHTIFQRHAEIVAAYLFGSHARGDASERSDIDIAVLFHHPVDFRFELMLGVELEEALKGKDVDLINLNRQKLQFQHRVLREGKLIYCADESAEQQFRERVIIMYCDFEPKLRRHYQELRQSLKEAFEPHGEHPNESLNSSSLSRITSTNWREGSETEPRPVSERSLAT